MSGKCSSKFNLRNLDDDDAVTSIYWETVKEWKLISNKEVSLSSHKNLSSHHNENQEFITSKWVNSEKYVNGKLNVNCRLIVRGFQEDSSNDLSGSPKCSKESLLLILNITTPNWTCQSINIKSAVLQTTL